MTTPTPRTSAVATTSKYPEAFEYYGLLYHAHQLERELTQLAARVKELEGDRAMLDWLADYPEQTPYLEDGIWRIPYPSGGVGTHNSRILRDAIRAAMNHKTK